MRADAIGFFWQDTPVVKEAAAPKEKRTPPEPVWLRPDYLPGLEEAQRFAVHVMTDDELIAAQRAGERLIFDIEIYHNYFLVAFTSLKTGWVSYFELHEGCPLDVQRFGWIMLNFTLVGFNSYNFDVPMASLALAGCSTKQMKEAANLMIVEQWRPSDVIKRYKAKRLTNLDHIDLIEVAPLQASLKIYGGRLHAPRMQDLPFHHAATLSPEQMAIVRWYCVNDLTTTAFMHEALLEQLDLRAAMSKQYGVDLRSKSDAQLAEAVISTELERLNGSRCERPVVPPGTVYRYQVPGFIRYESALMQWALSVVANAAFVVPAEGFKQELPKEIGELKIPMAGAVYTMGVGGLHSTEKKVAYRADKEYVLIDRDVTSYYPMIILNLGLFPQHLGTNFLRVYRTIVDRRIEAKQAGNKVVADSLKITVNGSFGKLGSTYSVLYSPHLMTQVTVTGQLSLLMLIERIELAGINVISANTDGVVIRCPRARETELAAIVAGWERDTGFATEEARYVAYYGRDVNTYIAVKEGFDKKTKQWTGRPAGTKTKGAYAPSGFSKNPTNRVCVEAAEALLAEGVPVHDTIRSCRDVRKFVSVRKVKGGAVQGGQYLGSSIRWYYATGEQPEMVYASNGNKVPRSDGAKPLMDLPANVPDDVNYQWYEEETYKILREIAYIVD